MTKLPAKKTTQDHFVKTALRLPPKLHAQLLLAAKYSGRSLNAEILARLQSDQLDEIRRQNAEIKAMLQQLLDKT